MRVKDIMSQPVYCVRDSDPIERVAALLADKKITAAPVLDDAGKLVGMVSEGDLLWLRVPEDPTAHPVGVEEPAFARRPVLCGGRSPPRGRRSGPDPRR